MNTLFLRILLVLLLLIIVVLLLTGCGPPPPPPDVNRCKDEAQIFRDYTIPIPRRMQIYQDWKKRCPGLVYIDDEVRRWLDVPK